ncbi:glycosyltransferase family 117 protein [Porphyromonas loveana]|uniref:glycosyltransferase family 117 protein n=2 Tax=Porphyromonas loveana TaxID=1884669 RepID=UPI0035A003CC
MDLKRFRFLNNVAGWAVFAVAAIVYLMTIEPTASLWDCAEFIVCVNKLEIGHPPGAPFFMLVYNVVSHFTSDPAQVAWFANATSALASAFTILFLFWTITHLVRRMLVPLARNASGMEEPTRSISLAHVIAILGSGAVGALAYTFSDTFWFSAVEAEVYALSSFFTAAVFWLMLKWEERADNPRSDRWLVLIAYMMGLSIGVHLLNLLCIPAMALVYYYRRSAKPTNKGAFIALIVSFVLIIVMMYGVIQGIPKVAGVFDVFAVNTLGLSFNSGLYFYFFLLAAILIWSVSETYTSLGTGDKKSSTKGIRMRVATLLSIVLMGIPFIGSGVVLGIILTGAIAYWLFASKHLNVRFLHTALMSMLVILVGFSSYGVILVRAVANPPMNENAPSNAFSLRSYLAREQYGSTPLFYGPTFASQPVGLKDGESVTGPSPKQSPGDKDQYETLYTQREYDYGDTGMMLFPRVYSSADGHPQAYNIWMGRAETDSSIPTFGENLKFFFNYQVNYMYWRYFLWNFVGRQNDLQGDGGLLRGNAMTGIPFIDKMLIGPTDGMPDFIAKNPGHNVYYMLPLLLGLIGISFQLMRKEKGTQSFWITFLLFFMTGLAIVLYLNQPPGQPRERDYAYAGSFYAFCIWIGFGVAGLADLLRRAKLSETAAAVVASVVALLIPLQMAGQNWDDHDRSGRYVGRDFGVNYLESCEPNAIIFTYGDNDTFPLWYAQEVEGIRTDVRVSNLSYLGADWYVRQMKQQAYLSAPLPLNEMSDAFISRNAFVRVDPTYSSRDPELRIMSLPGTSLTADGKPIMHLSEAVKIATRPVPYGNGVMPSENLYLPVDSQALGEVFGDSAKVHMRSVMDLSLAGKGILSLADLSILDLIANNEWKRPIYWAVTSPSNSFSNLPDYLRQTGMANQLVPFKARRVGDNIDVERMYTNVMTKFRFGGANNPKVYFDENIRNSTNTYRVAVFAPLAMALIKQGDMERARKVLAKCLKEISPVTVPYDYRSLVFAQALYEAGMRTEADAVVHSIAASSMRTLDWFFRLSESRFMQMIADGDMERELQTVGTALRLSTAFESNVMDEFLPKFQSYYNSLYGSQSGGEQ